MVFAANNIDPQQTRDAQGNSLIQIPWAQMQEDAGEVLSKRSQVSATACTETAMSEAYPAWSGSSESCAPCTGGAGGPEGQVEEHSNAGKSAAMTCTHCF